MIRRKKKNNSFLLKKEEEILAGILQIDAHETEALEIVQQELVIEPSDLTTLTRETDLENLLTGEIEKLTDRIDIVENVSENLDINWSEISRITEDFEVNLASVKISVKNEQDRINDLEKRISNLNLETHYTADYPNIWRFFLRILTGEDEIFLRGQIAQSETKITQWEKRTLELQNYFSQLVIAGKKLKTDINSVNGVQEGLRKARLDITKWRRVVTENTLQKTNEEAYQTISNNYVQSLETLRQLGPKFAEQVAQTKENSKNAFEEIFKIKIESSKNLNIPVLDQIQIDSSIPNFSDLKEKNK